MKKTKKSQETLVHGLTLRWNLVAVLAVVALLTGFWVTKVWWARPMQAGEGVADVLRYYLPNVAYHAEQIRLGRWPLWNPYEFAGMPMSATLEYGPYYPLNLVFLFFSIPTAHLVSGMLHSILLTAFTFGYLRYSLKVRPAAAAFGAMTVGMSGWAVQQMMRCPDEFRSAAYFPLVLWLTERVLARPSLARASALACACAVQFLAGETEISARTALFLGPYIVMRLLCDRERSRNQCARAGMSLALAGVLTIGLVAIQLLPTYETSLQSARAPGALSFEEVTRGGVESASELFERLVHADSEPNPYLIGGIPLALGLAALFFRARRTESVFYAVTACIAFELLRGSASWVSWLFYHLPTGSSFRAPVRYLFFLVFSVGCLSALGLDALATYSNDKVGRNLRTALLLVFGALGAVSLMWLFPSSSAEFIVAASIGVTLVVSREYVGGLPGANGIQRAVLGSVFTLSLIAPAFYMDMTAFNFPKNLDLAGLPADVRACLDRAREPADRVYVDATLLDGRRIPMYGPLTMTPCINGFSPFMPNDFWDLVKDQLSDRHKPQPGEANTLPATVGLWGGLSLANGAGRDLNVLGVRYIVLGLGAELVDPALPPPLRPDQLPPSWEILLSAKNMLVARNKDAWPRAFVAAGSTSPTDTTVPIPGPRPVAIEAYEPERVVLHAAPGQPGTLVLTDQAFPGWRAYVDGETHPIFKVMNVFRGVVLDGADHRVEFRYEPTSRRIGVCVSLLTGLTMALVSIISAIRKSRPGSDGPPA